MNTEEKVAILQSTKNWADAASSLQLKKGQRYPTPSPGSGDAVFYSSLLKENPNSPMAIIFVFEHGLLPNNEHDQLGLKYERVKKGTSAVGGTASPSRQ